MKIAELMRILDHMVHVCEVSPESEILVSLYKREEDHPLKEEHIRNLHLGRVDWLWSDPVDVDDFGKFIQIRVYNEPSE